LTVPHVADLPLNVVDVVALGVDLVFDCLLHHVMACTMHIFIDVHIFPLPSNTRSFMFVIAMDDVASKRRQLILKGAALVSVISAWMMIRFRYQLTARPPISYGPMFPGDE
jgi:hypothetical protein